MSIIDSIVVTEAPTASSPKKQYDSFLQELMTQNNTIINQEFFKLPELADITAGNLNIQYDPIKQNSYLFYVENPIIEGTGYLKEQKVFVIKAKPLSGDYVSSKNAKRVDDLNKYDGDTISFDLDSIIDYNTAFTFGDTSYSSFKRFLEANNQTELKVRHIGYNAPEIDHYTIVPISDHELHKHLVYVRYEVACANPDTYTMENRSAPGQLDTTPKDKEIPFIKYLNNYCEYLGVYEEYDDGTIFRKIITFNKTFNKSVDYRACGLKAKNLMIDMLNKASDIRVVIDFQTLNRRASFDKDQDYLDDNGLLTSFFQLIDSFWNDFGKPIPYYYRNYNIPGKDAYSRSLGAIYIRVYVPELQSEAWVNLGKYILYHTDDFSLPTDDYNNVQNIYYNGFLSPVFKISSYNKKRFEIIDSFTHQTDRLIEERNTWYSKITGFDIDDLYEHTVILGDSIFVVPPTNIRSTHQTDHLKVPLLRSKGAAVKSLPNSQRLIELDLYFNSPDQINGKEVTYGKHTYYMNGLRSLIAMFKLTPFLPIENDYINQTLNIDAVTLVNFTVSTMPNYPKCIKATLTLAHFDFTIYMPELKTYEHDNPFATTIHYPAMRWYYQRLLDAGNNIRHLDFNSEEYLEKAYGKNTALVPMSFFDSVINFYIPDRLQLEERLKILEDPKPILTQEQLTDIMKIGAEKIKPLVDAIQKLSEDEGVEEAFKTLFAPTELLVPDGTTVDSITHLDDNVSDPKSYSFPLFFLAVEGEGEITSNLSVTDKTSFSHLAKNHIIASEGVKIIADSIPEYETNYSYVQLKALIPEINRILGLYGSITSFKYKVTSSGLKLSFILPLPIELRQSTYEMELIVKKVHNQFGSTSSMNEVDNFLQYNELGYLGVPITFSFPLNFYANNQNTHSRFYLQDYHKLGNIDLTDIINKSTFSNDLSTKVLLYLYSLREDSKTDETLGNTTDDVLLNEKYDTVYNSATGLRFNKYNSRPILVEQLTIGYANTFSQLGLKMIEGKAFQYTGAQDMQIQIVVLTKDQSIVEQLAYLPSLSADYARNYRRVLNCWPLRIESELTKLFGICETLIENVHTETVSNQPGLVRVTLTLSAVDRTVRQREAMLRLETEENNSGSTHYGSKGSLEVKGYFDLKTKLAKAELYPDLELPTVQELADAGFTLYGRKDPVPENISYQARFVDPDFYFVYGHALGCEIFRENFLKAFDNTQNIFPSYNLSDTQGAFTKLCILNKGNFDLINANKIADAQRLEYTTWLNKKYNFQDASVAVFNSLSEGQQITYSLGKTLAELGTSFWTFGEDAKIPFKENYYDILPESTHTAYASHKESILKILNDFLAKSIEELSANSTEKLEINGTLQTQIEHCEKMCKNTLKSVAPILYKALSMDRKSESANAAANHYEGTPTYQEAYYGYQEDDVVNIILALGDAYSGETYYNDQFVSNDADENSLSKYNWKLRMYVNNDPNNLIPYARVNKNTSYFATSLEDALQHGISFGPFGITPRLGKELKNLFPNENLKDYVYYFLDPYYRNLSSEELIEHKTKLLTCPGYSALAALRELIVLYKYYIENDILFSVYEVIQQQLSKTKVSDVITPALADAFKNEIVDEIGHSLVNVIDLFVNNSSSKNSDKSIHDVLNIVSATNTEEIDKEEQDYFDEYYDILSALSKFHTKNKSEAENIAYAVLKLDKKEPVAKAIVKRSGSITSFVDKYKKKVEEARTSTTVTSEQAARYKMFYEICLNHENIRVDELALEILELRSLYVANTSFSQNIAADVLNQLEKDEAAILRGKLIGMACCILEPLLIHPLMMQKHTQALTNTIQNVAQVSNSASNTYLRKFMFALSGRKILNIANMGIIPSTLEAKYRNYINQHVLLERSENPKEYLRDSFYDMIHYDKRGRMLRAFPTYYMFFVDEGREIGLWKLHDNFYASTAIAEIEIVQSRKIAAHTAHVVLSNLFNSYTQDDKDFVSDLDLSYGTKNIAKTVRESFNALFSPRSYFIQEEKERLNTPQPLTARLMPGTRMHIRMGYGANAADLPILFNGQIAEISNGEVVEIVAQGDGIELLNPLYDVTDVADITNKKENPVFRIFEDWLTNGATPKTILSILLTSEGTWGDKVAKQISNGFFNNRHPYGIEHFGDIFFKPIFNNSECVQNLFEINSRALYNNDKQEYVGLESYYKLEDGAPRISVQAQNKTFWDLLHICASTAPDYVCGIVPFEMRSSIFLGKGRDYYAYAYEQVNASDEQSTFIREKRKPYEQYHYYTSYSDIISNDIVATNKFLKTNAVGLYSETGWFGNVKPKQTEPLYIDFSIYPEFQRSMTVDTQFWAQGLPIVGNMFGFTADTKKEVDDSFPGAKEIAWRMTASALKQSVKDMYQGALNVIGDPSVKPNDRMIIQDLYENMQGSCWVESVVHSFNAQTGFTTSIYADCINEIDDQIEKQNDLLTRSVVSLAATTYIVPAALNQTLKHFNHINRTIGQTIINYGMKISTKIDDGYIKNLLSIIKVDAKQSNAIARYVLDLAIGAGKQFDVSDPHKIKKEIRRSLKSKLNSIVLGNNAAFYNAWVSNFDNISKKLIDIKAVDTLSEYAKLLGKNADELNHVTGKEVKNIIKVKGVNSTGLSVQEQRNLFNSLDVYDAKLIRSVNESFSFSDDFLMGIDKLVDYLIEQDMPDEILKHMDTLLDVVNNKGKFTSIEHMKNVSKSLKACADVCDNADLLESVVEVATKTKNISKVFDTAQDIKKVANLKEIIVGLGVASGPVGIAASVALFVIETIVGVVIGAYATEALERYLQNLGVMRIYPLSKNGRVMTAGIMGHKGLVVGSPTEFKEDAWTQFVMDTCGAKPPTGIVSFLCQGLFYTDKIRAVTARYATQNNVPDVINSSFEEQAMRAEFDKNFNKRVSLLAESNPLLTLELKRFEDLEKSSKYFVHYLAKTEKNSNLLTKDTTSNFYPIEWRESINRHIESGIIMLLHHIRKPTTGETLMITYDKGIYEAPVFKETDDKLNVPILRNDALTMLDMLVNAYVEEISINTIQDGLEEKILKNVLTITSATIVNGTGYDATGYVVRLTSMNEQALANACLSVKNKLNDTRHCINYIVQKSEHILGVAIPLEEKKKEAVEEDVTVQN